MRSTAARVSAVVATIVLGLAVAGFILANQTAFQPPTWLPFAGADRYVVEAEFSTAQAVMPGQGQPVTIAGVRVGLVTAVTLRNGRAVARLELEPEHAPLHRDATIVLRPRTPLKDMYLALEPGTGRAPAIPDGGTLAVTQTTPDVNVDEVLASLDADARAYLTLLLDAAGTGLDAQGRSPGTAAVADLRGALKQLEPLARDGRRATALVAQRHASLRRAVHHLEQVATELGRVDAELTRFVDAGAATFGAFAAQRPALEQGLAALPATLEQTTATLTAAAPFADALGDAAAGTRPAARALDPALRATTELLAGTEDVVRDELRPFARDVQPLAAALRPAAADLAEIAPALHRTAGVVEQLFRAAAYNPPGAEQGYTFWGSWLAHVLSSLTDDQDAHGPVIRTLPLVTCPQLDAIAQVEAGNETLRAAIRLLRLPDRAVLCPQSPLAATTGTTGTGTAR